LRPVWMTNHPPSVLWHCWFGHQTCKNRRPYNLYCVGADVKSCSINQSINQSGYLVKFKIHIFITHFAMNSSCFSTSDTYWKYFVHFLPRDAMQSAVLHCWSMLSGRM